MLKSIIAVAVAIRSAIGGLLQIAGIGAGATRTMTVPDADFTVARTDAAQSFIGSQTFGSSISVGNATPSTSGAGVTFPATQSTSSDANTLDDYEEGTFTPTINSSGGGVGTYAASGQVGQYTKIGNRVSFTIWLEWTNHSGSGTMSVGGLPFTSSVLTNLWTAVSVSSFSGGLTLGANSYLLPSIPNNSTLILLYQTAVGGITPATVALDTSGQLLLSGSYQV